MHARKRPSQHAAPAAGPATSSAPPPARRDPWFWLALLAIVPLLLHMRGAPWGVPVADDFDYLHRVMFSGTHTLLDGCGSIFYWRPFSRQVYFEALWRVILSAPAVVAVLHALLLALTAGILYRALRVTWPAPAAWTAATFVLFAESARMLVTWPSNFQDLAAMFFAALALHAAAHRRLALALGALALSLFSKEAGVLVALLLPFMPQRGGMPMRERVRWAAWTAGLVAVWGLAYVSVSRSAGLTLPSLMDSAAAAAPVTERMGWALANSARSAFSLPAIPVAGERWIWIALAVLLAASLMLTVLRPAARARARALRGWPMFGMLWFALAGATLLAIFPTWAAYRGLFAVMGFGIMLAALFGAAHPWLLAGLVAVRLAAFAMSPGPPAIVSEAALVTGAQIDYPNLVRLQRLLDEARELLQSEHPELPPGAAVVQHHLPLGSEWAFVGSKALRTWYADSTLEWVRFDAFSGDTTLPVAAILEYQPGQPLALALVEPAAMKALLAAERPMRTGDWPAALGALEAAEALQRDPHAGTFLGTVVSMRALALFGLERHAEADADARRGLELWPANHDSRYVLALLRMREGRHAEAEAQLDTLLAAYPGDTDARRLRERVREARAGAP